MQKQKKEPEEESMIYPGSEVLSIESDDSSGEFDHKLLFPNVAQDEKEKVAEDAHKAGTSKNN